MDWLLNADTIPAKFGVMIVAILLFVAVMAIILGCISLPRRLPGALVAFVFLIPTIVFVGFGLLYPAVRSMIGSFQDRTATNWVGLANFAKVLTQSDFQIVLRNTAIWVLLVPFLATGIGLVYAVLVDRTRVEKLAKTLIFLPMAISMVGASVIWRFMYQYKEAGRPQVGLMNQMLVLFGGQPQQFLMNPPWNNIFLIVVMIWIQAGFAMTVLSAAIKAIPDDIVEAARLDGAGGWRMFASITVPYVRPSIVVVLTTIAMTTLKAFDIVRTMTGGNYQTSVIANEFYTQLKFGERGVGAALAVVLFVLVVPIVIYNVRQMRKSGDM